MFTSTSHHQREMYSKYVKDSLHLSVSCRVALTYSHRTRRKQGAHFIDCTDRDTTLF